MNGSSPHPRYERKFVVDQFGVPELLAVVRRHPAAFREVYPPRIVNNVYLDTPGLRDYHDHVNGISRRLKTRIRWYGAWSGRIPTPTLEQKFKRGHVSLKAGYPLPLLVTNGHIARADLESTLDGADLALGTRSAMRHLRPSLFNRYHRHYFLSADRRFRLTVDSGLQFASPNRNGNTPLEFSTAAAIGIIELKFDIADALTAPPITNAFPFRMVRCSKYVLGVTRLGNS